MTKLFRAVPRYLLKYLQDKPRRQLADITTLFQLYRQPVLSMKILHTLVIYVVKSMKKKEIIPQDTVT